jgi:hypothetical protein
MEFDDRLRKEAMDRLLNAETRTKSEQAEFGCRQHTRNSPRVSPEESFTVLPRCWPLYLRLRASIVDDEGRPMQMPGVHYDQAGMDACIDGTWKLDRIFNDAKEVVLDCKEMTHWRQLPRELKIVGGAECVYKHCDQSRPSEIILDVSPGMNEWHYCVEFSASGCCALFNSLITNDRTLCYSDPVMVALREVLAASLWKPFDHVYHPDAALSKGSAWVSIDVAEVDAPPPDYARMLWKWGAFTAGVIVEGTPFSDGPLRMRRRSKLVCGCPSFRVRNAEPSDDYSLWHHGGGKWCLSRGPIPVDHWGGSPPLFSIVAWSPPSGAAWLYADGPVFLPMMSKESEEYFTARLTLLPFPEVLNKRKPKKVLHHTFERTPDGFLVDGTRLIKTTDFHAAYEAARSGFPTLPTTVGSTSMRWKECMKTDWMVGSKPTDRPGSSITSRLTDDPSDPSVVVSVLQPFEPLKFWTPSPAKLSQPGEKPLRISWTSWKIMKTAEACLRGGFRRRVPGRKPFPALPDELVWMIMGYLRYEEDLVGPGVGHVKHFRGSEGSLQLLARADAQCQALMDLGGSARVYATQLAMLCGGFRRELHSLPSDGFRIGSIVGKLSLLMHMTSHFISSNQ